LRNPNYYNKIRAFADGFSPSLSYSPLLEQSFKGFCFLKRIQSLTGSSESPTGKMNEAGNKIAALTTPVNGDLMGFSFTAEVKGTRVGTAIPKHDLPSMYARVESASLKVTIQN
jgi:hypothetical protein